MGLLDRLQTRAAFSDTATPERWLVDLLGAGQETYSGKVVTPGSALSLVPVFSAVQLISGAVGGFPLMVYRRLNEGGRERATTHRTYSMLHDQPNDWMGADEFWEIVTTHLLLWGNHVSAKERGPDGRVSKLWPLPPGGVKIGRVKLPDGRFEPVYEFDGKTYGHDEVLHIRGLSLDGLIGLSPIQQARNALANQVAREEFTGKFWKNGAHHSALLTHPQELGKPARRRLEKGWAALHSGLAHAGKTLILEEGMDLKQLGMPLADAQYIEQEKLGRSDVALLFRVPAQMLLADSGGTLRYENAAAEADGFVKWTARRWTGRIEGSLKRDADIFLQGSRFYPEFLFDALLRADPKTRSAYYTAALNPSTGWMEPEEVRERENLNPLTDEQLAARKERLAASKPVQPAEPEADDEGDDNTTEDDE